MTNTYIMKELLHNSTIPKETENLFHTGIYDTPKIFTDRTIRDSPRSP